MMLDNLFVLQFALYLVTESALFKFCFSSWLQTFCTIFPISCCTCACCRCCSLSCGYCFIQHFVLIVTLHLLPQTSCFLTLLIFRLYYNTWCYRSSTLPYRSQDSAPIFLFKPRSISLLHYRQSHNSYHAIVQNLVPNLVPFQFYADHVPHLTFNTYSPCRLTGLSLLFSSSQ